MVPEVKYMLEEMAQSTLKKECGQCNLNYYTQKEVKSIDDLKDNNTGMLVLTFDNKIRYFLYEVNDYGN